MKRFTYEFTVAIGDTNATGNVYFANYFRWQGIAREMWVLQNVENIDHLMQSGLLMITRTAECRYFKDLHLFDTVRIECTIFDVRKVAVSMRFHFYRDADDLVASGSQQVVFANSKHQLTAMPLEFRRACGLFQE